MNDIYNSLIDKIDYLILKLNQIKLDSKTDKTGPTLDKKGE